MARAALRWELRAFLTHPNRFNVLLGHAVRLQCGEISEEAFRQELDRFYAGLDRSRLLEELDFASQVQELNRPRGYKIAVSQLREPSDPGSDLQRAGVIWRRRFSLLHHLGIRSDVLILRQGEQIPPHGHYRVVSGFYVLDGEVAVRHYNRVQEVGPKLLVRKTLDTVLVPGGYTTNSEYHQNIHWLCGLSPCCYLFRVTASGVPTPTFGSPGRDGERVYVDPTGAADGEGLITASYVSAEQARGLRFTPGPVDAYESADASPQRLGEESPSCVAS